MKFVLGTKEAMTQVYDAEGVLHPATILRVSPHKVTQVKTVEKDGYSAVQIATGEQKAHRLTKAEIGHRGGNLRHVREFRPNINQSAAKKETIEGVEQGVAFDASAFVAGDRVSVSATSKGKGFQGVVKRHGFSGANKTHGTKHNERAPGSIGATGPNHVFKGTRMAGRMGGDRITVKNLTVLEVNHDKHILLIAGAVPGRRGTLVEVRGIE